MWSVKSQDKVHHQVLKIQSLENTMVNFYFKTVKTSPNKVETLS
jgi:hypothetical protein